MPPIASIKGITIITLTLSTVLATAQERKHAELDSPFGTYGDNGLPFFCQTLDARKVGFPSPGNNLTPRGIILHLGYGIHACFDPDLLRLALVWKEAGPGDYLTMNGMAPGSYRQPHRKAPSGQSALPTPIGTPLFANGIHPGVQTAEAISLTDPRSPSLDEAEVGRGPLPRNLGKWIGLRLDQEGPVAVYETGGCRVEERWRVTTSRNGAADSLQRILRVSPHKAPLVFVLQPADAVTIKPSDRSETWTLTYNLAEPGAAVGKEQSDPPHKATPLWRTWKEAVKVTGAGGAPTFPLAFDEIPLPLPNPWKRNVRPSDFDFFPDGRLALVTFDGDVWISAQYGTKDATWRRFASGLHEPMGLRIVDEEIVIFDRNGLTRLVDRDGNGEADHHLSLSDLAAQTAETREFAMSFERRPGGGFYLAKGGQVGNTRGKLNGTIVEISEDGQEIKTVATGLRQPFLGVDPRTGLLTASDQQGHWIPATPLHVIRPGSYYGFQPTRLGPAANEGRIITDPPLWIPHFVNQSGARQVWLRDAKMGPFNDTLIHLGYNQPAIFKVYLDAQPAQAAIAPLLTAFPESPTGFLGGRVNPRDGLLYVGGLNLWGTVGKRIQGLYRVGPAEGPCYVPRIVRGYKEGVLLTFDHPLEHDQATEIAHYAVDRWNYKRTDKYGSGHFKLNGTPGQEALAISCIYISEDHQSVFLGIPNMQPVHSMRVSFRVHPQFAQSAYLTLNSLDHVDLTGFGFEETQVDLTPGTLTPGAPRRPPSAALGGEIARQYGCFACHSIDGSRKLAEEPSLVVGPGWQGLYGSSRAFTDGSSLKSADEDYLRDSILHPSRKVTKGFETGQTGVGMPSYLGVLNDDQITSLVLFIKSLQ